MEYLDIVDENGVPTGETVERKYAHANGIMHHTAHVWLVRKINGKAEILLQKRSADKDSHPLCYDISSAGHIPAGCDYRQSAIRELSEELGVAAREDELIEIGNRRISYDAVFRGVPFHDRQFSKVFMLYRNIPVDNFTLQAEEVDSVMWMDFETCMESVKNNTIKHCINYSELEMIKNAL